MPVMALLNEYVSVNGVNVSNLVKQGTLAVEATALDSTAMGDGWTKNTAGLKSGTLTIEAMDDISAGQLDGTLWAIFGTVVPFAVRLKDTAVAADNPEYSGEVLIQQLSIGGSIGELAMKNTSWPTSGPVERAVS